MNSQQHMLPMRRTSSGEEIETRPLYVEEWLDSLPYVDFKKTSRLLYEATHATNAIPIKAGVRQELVALYNRPYRYYIDSQIKAGAQHTLQSIETMQGQIEILKMIAVNLGYACKLAAEETLKQKTLWRRTKPPLEALLTSLNYLSHALIFSFLEYSPTPKAVWRELHFIYSFAEGLNQEQVQIVPLGGEAKKDMTTIAEAYTRIVMASVADPHHLPFGAVWEIYEQLKGWARYVEIRKLTDAKHAGGQFVVDMQGDDRPLPYSKFKGAGATDQYRLIDAGSLGGVVEDQLERLAAGQPLDAGVRFSPYFAKSVLRHMGRAYGLPPERSGEREGRQGKLNLARGLNAVYFFLNDEREFSHAAGHDSANDDEATQEVTPAGNYVVENWNLVDQGRGGFAVIKADKPAYPLRVGELIGVAVRSTESVPHRKWRIGIVRWMMIRQGKSYRIGVELMSGIAEPVALRAIGGSKQDCRFRRALLLSDPARPGESTVITERGLHIIGRELEVNQKRQNVPYAAGPLAETSVAFEHFHLLRK